MKPPEVIGTCRWMGNMRSSSLKNDPSKIHLFLLTFFGQNRVPCLLKADSSDAVCTLECDPLIDSSNHEMGGHGDGQLGSSAEEGIFGKLL